MIPRRAELFTKCIDYCLPFNGFPNWKSPTAEKFQYTARNAAETLAWAAVMLVTQMILPHNQATQVEEFIPFYFSSKSLVNTFAGSLSVTLGTRD